MSSYKKSVSFTARREATKNIINKYPDKCPIYLSFDNKLILKHRPGTNFNKYIINNSITVGQYLSILKRRIEMSDKLSVTLFINVYKDDKLVNTILPQLAMTLGEVYEHNKDQDGFLYMHLIGENTFG